MNPWGWGKGKPPIGVVRVAAEGVGSGMAELSPPLRSRYGPCKETVKRALLIHAGTGHGGRSRRRQELGTRVLVEQPGGS